MNSKEDLCELIEESRLTLIGYTFKDERIKDELISNFNYVEIKEIDSSFSFISFLRNEKINQVLSNKNKFDYILLDLNNINPISDGDSKWDRVSFIRNVLHKIQEVCQIEKPEYKIIITSPIYNSDKQIDLGHTIFVGGNQPIYMADLAIVLKENIAKVIKNRNGSDGDYILYNTKQSVEF